MRVEEASPDIGDPSWILQTLYGGAQAGAHAARLAGAEGADGSRSWCAYAEASAGLTVVEYLKAVAARQALVAALRRFFERYDLLLTPTLGLPAFPLGIVGPREVAGREVTHLGWTLCYPFNYSGQPADLRPGRLDGERPARRPPDRRPAPGGRAGAPRRGGLRGEPPVDRPPTAHHRVACGPIRVAKSTATTTRSLNARAPDSVP